MTSVLRSVTGLGRIIGVLKVATLVGATPMQAQRTLHWRDVSVGARIAEDGSLRIVERQTIVFTGAWNGGERRFNIRRRQKLRFEGIRRIDSTGQAHAMYVGDLSAVDQYAFTEGNTLRWRSRLPSDPAFNNAAITYELTYSLANVLVKNGDTWVLDHDFAFPDRDGVIENLSVQLLEFGPVWKPTMLLDGRWEARNLPPGEGFIVHVPLRYAGTADLPTIGAAPFERALLAVIAFTLLVSFGRRLIRRERQQGRLDPLPSPETVDEAWLGEHVFKHLPEVIGAAWDNETNAAEVTAILARLVAEGRLRSEVKPGGFLDDPVLHLELLVDRDRFHDYERRLIDSLFEPGERTTDTDRIRKRYKKSGFDPASKIQKPLKDLVKRLVPEYKVPKPPALPSLLGFLGAMALMIVAVVQEPIDAPVVFLSGAVIVVCYLFALGGAVAWRKRVHGVRPAMTYFALPLGVATLGIGVLLATGGMQASVVALTGVTLMMLALANSIFNQARSRESAERIAFRRRLATARAYFLSELAHEKPVLKDSWFPYLIAFGLAKHMDKWFRAFGGEAANRIHDSTIISSGSRGGGSSNSGGGWTGFGGGGGFAGGGSSGSWVAAASSISAGVAAPSSDGGGSSGGGGGGGGGGGSSGGGGGGGW